LLTTTTTVVFQLKELVVSKNHHQLVNKLFKEEDSYKNDKIESVIEFEFVKI